MSGLLGLAYTEDEEEDEQGGLVAYEHEEEEKGEQDDSSTPHKRRRLDEEENQEQMPQEQPRDEEEEAAMARRQRAVDELEQQYQHDEESEAPEESSHREEEEQFRTDFEDQSSFVFDGRWLMDIMLPPRPDRPPDAVLQGKILQFHRLRREGRAKSINEKIRHSRNFKNPYMLNWLVSHCGIDETGSNFPRELFDPAAIRREAAEVMERQKKQKAAQQNRTTIDFTSSGTTAAVVNPATTVAAAGLVPGAAAAAAPRPVVKVVEGRKRPAVASKWDQGDPVASAAPAARAPAAAGAPLTGTGGSRYAEYALAKKAEIEARLRQK